MQSTTENFWRMVHQEHIHLIVMLTACKEHGKLKCDMYWPCEVGDCLEYDEGALKITLVSVESLMPNLIKRKLLVKDQEVCHLQYLTWPDHGAPEEQDYKIIASLLASIDEYKDQGKVLLHCSAGIGRTGSLIAIYNLQMSAKSMHDYHKRCKSLINNKPGYSK